MNRKISEREWNMKGMRKGKNEAKREGWKDGGVRNEERIRGRYEWKEEE